MSVLSVCVDPLGLDAEPASSLHTLRPPNPPVLRPALTQTAPAKAKRAKRPAPCGRSAATSVTDLIGKALLTLSSWEANPLSWVKRGDLNAMMGKDRLCRSADRGKRRGGGGGGSSRRRRRRRRTKRMIGSKAMIPTKNRRRQSTPCAVLACSSGSRLRVLCSH